MTDDPQGTPPTRAGRIRAGLLRLGWFAALWLLGVGAVTLTAGLLRLWLT